MAISLLICCQPMRRKRKIFNKSVVKLNNLRQRKYLVFIKLVYHNVVNSTSNRSVSLNGSRYQFVSSICNALKCDYIIPNNNKGSNVYCDKALRHTKLNLYYLKTPHNATMLQSYKHIRPQKDVYNSFLQNSILMFCKQHFKEMLDRQLSVCGLRSGLRNFVLVWKIHSRLLYLFLVVLFTSSPYPLVKLITGGPTFNTLCKYINWLL